MTAPTRLRHRVLAAIADRALWSPGDRVAVAVSGGRDSVALLDLLVSTAGAHGGRLEVVTVDHGIRPGSDADAEFVVALAGSVGLPVTRRDLGLGPDTSEVAARDARHAVFAALPVDRVALAHHRDDQAETVLLHLLRGSGTHGAAGMAWRRDRIVRPLLGCSRDELAAWAVDRGLAWREDPTNADPGFLRNALRLEVLPRLEAARPGAAEALARSAALLADDDAWLDALVDAEPLAAPSARGFVASWVAEAPAGLVARALRRVDPGLGAAQVQALRAFARKGSGVVEITREAAWIVRDGWVGRRAASAGGSGRSEDGG